MRAETLTVIVPEGLKFFPPERQQPGLFKPAECGVPLTVAWDPSVLKELRKGVLLPGDEATAKIAGVEFKAPKPDKKGS